MSLTTNTTSLQEILAAVNALPEAGSGGGGGALETCSVKFATRAMPEMDGSEICVYLDANMTAQTVDWSTKPTINVPKGSIVTLYKWLGTSSMTNATQIYTYMGCAAVQINGDATLTYM